MGLMDMLGQKGKSIELISELVQQSGGIGNLVKNFEQQGLGGIVQSWIGNGQNMPINPTQIASVLGDARITALAEKFGLSGQEVQDLVAKILPQVVDKLSPQGKLPSEGFNLSSLLSLGKSILAH